MKNTRTADAHLAAAPAADTLNATTYPVIAAISFAHLLNDMMQSVLLAIYPMLKLGLNLSFTQIGLITLAYQLTASLLQPLIGLYTDRRPMPYSLSVGMGFTLLGLLSLSQAGSFDAVLVSAILIGIGSSVFHPESSRVARMAAGNQPGLAHPAKSAAFPACSSASPSAWVASAPHCSASWPMQRVSRRCTRFVPTCR